MESFPVSPEDCLILRALQGSGSLREAARLLRCDPAGLLRKAQRISAETGLLQKAEGKWRLTPKGARLVGWVDEAIQGQKKILDRENPLRISSALWMAEQFVAPHVEELLKKIPGLSGLEISGTVSDFEGELLRGHTDFVVLCQPPNDPAIAHKVIAPEKWVAVVPPAWVKKDKAKKVGDLLGRPFVLHKDLNPDLLLPGGALLSEGGRRIVMDSLISVRAAVIHGLGWGFVPEILVREALADSKLETVAHDFDLQRKLSVWWLRHVKGPKAMAPAVCAWAKAVCERA